MKRFKLKIILICFLMFTTVLCIAACEKGDKNFKGKGTFESPFLIETKEDLILFSSIINQGSDYNKKCYKLNNDINLEDMEWVPIGFRYTVSTGGGYYFNGLFYPYYKEYFDKAFCGSFNGDGHIISNFTIAESKLSEVNFCAGLFGYLEGANISNLSVENFTINISDSVLYVSAGGIAGYNNGLIINCHASGAISSYSDVVKTGLITGTNYGTISNSYATGDINATAKNLIEIGGLAGSNHRLIEKSYAANDISVSSDENVLVYAGGIVGSNKGEIDRSYAIGNISVSSKSTTYIGGLIGQNEKNIKNSYATGKITTNSSGNLGHIYAGGLIGYSNGIIENCYTTGEISANSQRGISVGGVLGYGADTLIKNCYTAVNITANAFDNIDNRIDAGNIAASFNSEKLINSFKYEGQIVNLSNYKFLNEEGLKCTLEQLNSAAFYTLTLGWDNTIWDFDKLDFKNGSYPKLIFG